jgi:hypothetical protein
MTYIKQVMLIGSGGNSIETREAYAIKGDYDFDALSPKLTFNLPYLLPGQRSVSSSQVDITKLKKYDTVQLYYGEFDNDPGDVGTDALTIIFNGYIETVTLSKTKTSFDYQITAMGTAGLCYSRNTFYEVTSDGDLTSFVPRVIEAAGLTSALPVKFIDVGAGLIPINVEGGKNVKEVFDDLKSRYALIITQNGKGELLIMRPSFLLNARNTSELGDYQWEFSFQDRSIFEMDYGDLTSNVNAVVVQGYGPNWGVAVDTIAVENNSGQVNYQSFERADLFSPEDCEKYAQEKLLELERNFEVSIKTRFRPEFMVGQSFTINDGDKYDGTQVFIMKKYSFTIDKGDVSATVVGYTHSLTILPENLVISNTGVADTDVLQLPEKGANVLWGARQ